MATYQEIAAQIKAEQDRIAERESAAGTLPYRMYQAWNEAGGEKNKALRQQESDVLTNYVGEAPELRQKYSNVWDPYAREALVGRGLEQAYKPLSDIRAQLSARAEALNAAQQGAVQAYGAETQRKQTEVTGLEGQYSRAFQQAQAEEAKRQWEEEQARAKQQWEETQRLEQEKWDYQKEQDAKQLELDYAQLAKSGSSSSSNGGLTASQQLQEQQNINKGIAILGSLVRYGNNGEVDFAELKEDGSVAGWKTREEAAYDLSAETGLSYQDSLNKIYENFKSRITQQNNNNANSQNMTSYINKSLGI